MGRAAIIMVFGFATSFGTIKYNLSKQAVAAVTAYASEYEHVIRRNVKNSVANIALREVLENLNWRADSLSEDPAVAYDQVFSWREDTEGTAPGVRIEIFDSNTDPNLPSMTALRIRAISEYDDIEDTTVVVVDRTSFSKYAYFTNYEGNIWFGSGDTIRGPLHTNDIFHINGDATFYGLMSSVADTYITSGSPNPYFLGGTNFGRPRIPMPEADDLEYLKEEAGTQDHLHDGELWLSFNNDGTYDWVCTRVETTFAPYSHAHLDSSGRGLSHTHPDEAGWEKHNSTHSASPDIQRYSDMRTNVSIGRREWHRHFGEQLDTHTHTLVTTSVDTTLGTEALDYEAVIATTHHSQDIHVQGTVDGRVTVYSAGHIWIDDDIQYADDPRDGVSDDVLGLMAYKSVTVTDNPANNDGHVWIDATIGSMTTELPPGADGSYASYEKCFHVENFHTCSPRGKLHVYGGIVQRERGAVGLGSTYGFDKDYEYDTRFLNQRPPKYPVLRENLIISWWE